MLHLLKLWLLSFFLLGLPKKDTEKEIVTKQAKVLYEYIQLKNNHVIRKSNIFLLPYRIYVNVNKKNIYNDLVRSDSLLLI